MKNNPKKHRKVNNEIRITSFDNFFLNNDLIFHFKFYPPPPLKEKEKI